MFYPGQRAELQDGSITLSKLDSTVLSLLGGFTPGVPTESISDTVINGDVVPLSKGTPVRISGNSGGTSIVVRALASTSLPAQFILSETIAVSASGTAVAVGYVDSIPYIGSYYAGQTIWLSPAGGWTTVVPSFPNSIQRLGTITAVNILAGTIDALFNIDNTQGLPNLSLNDIWLGNSSGIPQATPLSTVALAPNLTQGSIWLGNSSGIPQATPLSTVALTPTSLGTTVQAYNSILQSISQLSTSSGVLRRVDAANWTLDSTLPISSGGTGASTASQALINLGSSTIGASLLTTANPNAIRFIRTNANNTISYIDPTTFRSDIGLGTVAVQNSDNINFTGGSIASAVALGSIDSHSDVNTTSPAPTTNQYLRWGGSNWAPGSLPYSLVIACSSTTQFLTAGVAKETFRVPSSFTLTEVRASLTTASTGSSVIIDVNLSGVSVFGTTKLSINATHTTSTTASTSPTITTNSFVSNSEITIDIDQVGSTIPGAGLKIYLFGSLW